MDRPSVLQVTRQGDGQALDPAFFLPDGVQIQQRLRGMLPRAVAAVEDRDRGPVGQLLRAARHRVADDRHVGVAFDHLAGVEQRLALGGRAGGLGLGDRQHLPAQAQHRGLEGETRARGRLVEQGRQHLARHVQQAALRLHDALKPGRRLHDQGDLFQGELVGPDDVFAFQRTCH